MLLSTSSSLSGRPDLIGVSIAKHRPEHVDASAGERDERLVMTLAFPPLAVVKGATDRVLQGAEGRLVQDALQILIAAERPAAAARASRRWRWGQVRKKLTRRARPARRNSVGVT